MAAQVEFLIRNSKFDFIHSDQLWMAQYVLRLNVETLKRSNVRTVLDQHNAMYLIPQRMAAEARNPLARWLLKREARLMARYEAQICQQFDHVVWVTQEDYQAVQHQQNLLSQQSTNRKSTIPNPQSIIRNSKSEIRNSIIPICIDPSEIQPVGPLPHEPNILFLGGMHWPPNAEGVRWFVREVFPKVREKIPKTKFFAIGKSPPKELINTQGVVAPGYVEDIETYWKNSRVFVVPLQAGGGMRVKILDAWAHRLPVVSTTIGAEGIKYQEGEDIMIADDPQALAQILVRVLGDIELVQQLAEAGRATVEKHYDWRKVYSSWWDQVYSSLFELSGVL
jgi:glycosyltransferase involved in cell wall biosynthesis